MRTLKSTPLALTVGSQTWVRKVLREIGVPTLVVNSRSSRPIDPPDMSCDFVQPRLPYAECPRLVVLRVRLHEEALTGRGVLLGRLDDGVLDTDHAPRKSICRGRSAMTSPHRIPVSMNVSTSSRCCEGSAQRDAQTPQG